MNHWETPINFDDYKEIEGVQIQYSDLAEITQGAPMVGILSINGIAISGHKFGGPYIVADGYLYIPVLAMKFIGLGFRLSKINLKKLAVKINRDIKDLIFIDRVEQDEVYYYTDISKQELSSESF